MKAKRKTRTTLQPLAEAIARDARNKKALEAQFLSFYEKMKKTMHGNTALKKLDIPLEEVKASVKVVAHGFIFGIPMVRVEEPQGWNKRRTYTVNARKVQT